MNELNLEEILEKVEKYQIYPESNLMLFLLKALKSNRCTIHDIWQIMLMCYLNKTKRFAKNEGKRFEYYKEDKISLWPTVERVKRILTIIIGQYKSRGFQEISEHLKSSLQFRYDEHRNDDEQLGGGLEWYIIESLDEMIESIYELPKKYSEEQWEYYELEAIKLSYVGVNDLLKYRVCSKNEGASLLSIHTVWLMDLFRKGYKVKEYYYELTGGPPSKP